MMPTENARRCFSCICAIAGQGTECTTECGIVERLDETIQIAYSKTKIWKSGQGLEKT